VTRKKHKAFETDLGTARKRFEQNAGVKPVWPEEEDRPKPLNTSGKVVNHPSAMEAGHA
jgi:hypothetical protein